MLQLTTSFQSSMAVERSVRINPLALK